jgi:hypothetical protein
MGEDDPHLVETGDFPVLYTSKGLQRWLLFKFVTSLVAGFVIGWAIAWVIFR